MIQKVVPMIHLAQQVGRHVVMAEVPRHPRALRHPIQADAAIAAENTIAPQDRVHGSMEFQPRLLLALEESVSMDVVDHVAKNLTEGSPEAANDTGLFAVANGISAYNMAVDSFSVPTIGQSALQRGDIALRTTLCVCHTHCRIFRA